MNNRTACAKAGPYHPPRRVAELLREQLHNGRVHPWGLHLAGAPFAGLAPRVRDCVPVPTVDPMEEAVKQAEALVTLGVRKAIAGTFRRPDAKPTIGLPDAWSRASSGGLARQNASFFAQKSSPTRPFGLPFPSLE
jgi:hypothetical protein